jgi:protease-4
MLRWLSRVLLRLLFVLFALVGAMLASALALGAIVYFALSSFGDTRLPSRMVLLLQPDAAVAAEEVGSFSRFSQLLPFRRLGVEDILDALERAETDDRVRGVLLDASAVTSGMAEAQELREAIQRFQSKGKFVIAYADTYEEPSVPYYLASAAGQVWMQPSGDLGLTGAAIQTPFFKRILDRIGIRAELGGRYEYKGAVEAFTREDMSPPVRQNLQRLVDGWLQQLIRDIALSRKLGEAEVKALVERAPLTAEEAKGGRLIDEIGYREQALAAAKRQAGNEAELVPTERYLRRAGSLHEQGATIALIHGQGAIVRAPG